ncbi:NYN domain-containing protein [Marimonas arenosa]|uniref:NYN domain-containing protein n=1 Tax=Marimonas arenosa TaxID=1795305 RepID=A0AAE3WE32_9RHOB|nr:NYN domain-containing protein [Marimonas arenosa]MDQ2091561.1 NYN domain-containing protein [Marimonas arenosa]
MDGKESISNQVNFGAVGVAVFVDGENVNTGPAAEILRGVGGAAKAAIRRVYGNAQQLAKWCDAPGFRAVHTGSGKNSADVRLAIDAVHASHQGGIATFVIVTSDGDFSHLAHHLRERHFTVIGIGEPKTPNSFRAACSRFIEIIPIGSAASGEKNLDAMDRKVRDAIQKNGDRHGLPIHRLGPLMSKHGTKISTHPDRTWRNYLTKRTDIYHCDKRGPKAKVRWIGG